MCPQTERDVSVRQRAADLLYAMCDRSNAKQIVAEMLSYLETADYSIREEMVRLPISDEFSAKNYNSTCKVFLSGRFECVSNHPLLSVGTDLITVSHTKVCLR